MKFYAMTLMSEIYCEICGIDVKKETAQKRFGKYFCSEEHAEKYLRQRTEREERDTKEPRRESGGFC